MNFYLAVAETKFVFGVDATCLIFYRIRFCGIEPASDHQLIVLDEHGVGTLSAVHSPIGPVPACKPPFFRLGLTHLPNILLPTHLPRTFTNPGTHPRPRCP